MGAQASMMRQHGNVASHMGPYQTQQPGHVSCCTSVASLRLESKELTGVMFFEPFTKHFPVCVAKA